MGSSLPIITRYNLKTVFVSCCCCYVSGTVYSRICKPWPLGIKCHSPPGCFCVCVGRWILVPQQRRQWHPTPVLLPGKSHGQRSLEGYSPWGCKELDTTKRLHFHFSLSCIGEGNSNPLQCSRLENPRDREAWWAATYGVAQSRTRLK